MNGSAKREFGASEASNAAVAEAKENCSLRTINDIELHPDYCATTGSSTDAPSRCGPLFQETTRFNECRQIMTRTAVLREA